MARQSGVNSNSPSGRPPVLADVNVWLAGLVLLLLGVIVFFILGRGLPGERPPFPPGIPPDRADGPGKIKTTGGVVIGFKNNPHLDINAIRLRTDRAGIVTFDFRPHTAQAVMNIAKQGDSVEVSYAPHPNDEIVGYRLIRIKNLRTGSEISPDELPPPPDIPPNHKAEYFRVQNPRLLTDEYGGIVAIRSNHLLYHFKPGLVDDILPLMKTAPELGLSAVRRDAHFGFINIYGDTVYVVLSVTIDNKTFLVR